MKCMLIIFTISWPISEQIISCPTDYWGNQEVMYVNKIDIENIDMVWHPYVQMKEYKQQFRLITEAEGIYVKDSLGRQYIDGISSLWNVCLGHKNKEVIDAITEQLNELEYFSLYGYSNKPSIELAQKISEFTGNYYKRFFFTNSGSEAVDTAIKIVRQYFKNKGEGKKTKIISLINSFHGVTFGAMSVGGIPVDSEKFQPVLEGFKKIPPPYCYRCDYKKVYPQCHLACAKELEEVILEEGPETIAAFVAEPILGAGGIIVPPDDYFIRVKEICDRYGVKLIFDEISTGFGRLGTALGCDHWKVRPDIFVGAKGISSGYVPLGVVGVTDEIYDMFYGDKENNLHLNHGFTTTGHPVCCKAGVATLNYIQKHNLIVEVKEKGEFFRKELEELKEVSIVEDIRGKGMMWGIEVSKKDEVASLVSEIAHRKGLITFITDASNVIALFPPFITTYEELIKIKNILKESLEMGELRMKMKDK